MEASMQIVAEFSVPTFFLVFKQLGHEQYKPMYKSEVRHPTNGQQIWKSFHMNMRDLCNEDQDQEFRVDFFQFVSNGNHKFLSKGNTTANRLYQGNRNLDIKGKPKFNLFSIQKSISFLDYIFGGCHINLNVAIDFTLSNGDPNSGNSLHCKDMSRNQYNQALFNVGNILQYYNTDKKVATYGFGGMIAPVNRVSHCFALNGNIFEPECNGLDQVVMAY